jgi:hypothetical protein
MMALGNLGHGIHLSHGSHHVTKMGIAGMAGAKISQSAEDIARSIGRRDGSYSINLMVTVAVNFCYQATAQACAVYSPFWESMSVIEIFHQLAHPAPLKAK